MSKQPDYKSELDQFLQDFDSQPEAHSESRQQEESKYERINRLRDQEQSPEQKKKLWKGF